MNSSADQSETSKWIEKVSIHFDWWNNEMRTFTSRDSNFIIILHSLWTSIVGHKIDGFTYICNMYTKTIVP